MLSAVGVSLNTPMAPLVVFMDPRLLESVFSIIIGSAEGAFLQVTVFVGAVLLLFGYINFRSHGEFIRTIQERKQWQPVIGAFLGLTPGCGGAIFIMPLYLKGSVTFGTVVATLIATAGDSAFVMISKLPLHFVVISLLSLLAAILTGYLVDYSGVGEHLIRAREKKSEEELERMHQKADHMLQNVECATITGGQSDLITHIGHETRSTSLCTTQSRDISGLTPSVIGSRTKAADSIGRLSPLGWSWASCCCSRLVSTN